MNKQFKRAFVIVLDSLGIGNGKEKINMDSMPLKGWKSNVTYHERLKKSYDIIKNSWRAIP